MRISETQNKEPLWDEVIFYRTDFRPNFEGDFVNFATCIEPRRSIAETEELVRSCFTSIANWIIEHRDQFGDGDRFQIIIAWPKSIRETGRHIAKSGGTWDDLSKITDEISNLRFLGGWSSGVIFD